MNIVTLISTPGKLTITPELLENLRKAWGGGDAVWLSAGDAAEFNIDATPDNQWAVWQSLQDIGVDLVVQPARNRRKSVMLADMDSTIIQQECIDELADEVGFGNEVAAITRRAMDGEINFEDSLIERVLMLKGLKISVIDTVLATRISLMPGAEQLLHTLKSNGVYCALISGGFTAFTGYIANKLGFDEHRANVLNSDGSTLLGTVQKPILGASAKVRALQEITTKRGVGPDQVMAVGDGANDLDMLALAGSGVALHAKPSVAKQSDIRINHGDLTALLYLQGYRKEEFVS